MTGKPVKPQLHGIIDYVFSAILLAAPKALRLDKKATSNYEAVGTVFLAMNAVTDTPVALKPLLSFKDHQKADAFFLAGMGLLAATPMIRRNKKTLLFHIGFLTIAIAHYFLTDYNASGKE